MVRSVWICGECAYQLSSIVCAEAFEVIYMDKQMRGGVLKGLSKGYGEKHIPPEFLYDHVGSQMYEEITSLPEYYLPRAEIQLFKDHGHNIASSLGPNTVFVELGCGSAKKTVLLLREIKRVYNRCRYVGIDISATFLMEAKENLKEFYGGDDEIELIENDSLEGLKQFRERNPDANLCIAWLGSSVSHLSVAETVLFFRQLIETSNGNCKLLVCMDMWKDAELLKLAYKDRQGAFERFIINGMKNALSSIGCKDKLDMDNQLLSHEIVINTHLKRVQMYAIFNQDFNVPEHGIHIRQGEMVMVAFSTKYIMDDIRSIAKEALCKVIDHWGDPSLYTCHLLVPSFNIDP